MFQAFPYCSFPFFVLRIPRVPISAARVNCCGNAGKTKPSSPRRFRGLVPYTRAFPGHSPLSIARKRAPPPAIDLHARTA